MSNGVQWLFSLPQASHQGGIWERIVRSVRKILGALLKEQLVNDEPLLTLLCEVERILNDWPLTPLSDHRDDPELLMPSKLLLLRSNSCLWLDVFKGHDKYSKHWHQAQYMEEMDERLLTCTSNRNAGSLIKTLLWVTWFFLSTKRCLEVAGQWV